MHAAANVRDFAHFRATARALLAADVRPEEVSWDNGEATGSLFEAAAIPSAGEPVPIPRKLLALLEEASCHREPRRWSLLYRLLWRSTRGGMPRLLDDPADEDVYRVRQLARAVAREVHRMHAFVRFRERKVGGETHYVAWYEPEHHVVRRAAPFFVERFAAMRWTIATPEVAACWNGSELQFVPGPHARPDAAEDGNESLWRTYYAAMFNPARLNERLMTKEVPRHYWANLPEMQNVEALTRDAAARVAAMQEARTDKPRWSDRIVIEPRMRDDDLQACRRCPLWARATQAVRGEGPSSAALMLVGEQPGDEEDLAGRPFIGPAGRVLDRAIAQAGLDRGALYLTNAVKHFKWEPRGKRRLHKTPAQREADTCRDWLMDEIAQIRPKAIVALGATAARSLTGQRVSIAAQRGRALHHPSGAGVWISYHPSAILRAADEAEALFEALCHDLRCAHDACMDASHAH
jgi:DNA polymerase